MEIPQPIQRVGNQKVAHFVSAIVEDVSAPVGMFAFARIEMLVQSSAIKTAERKRVLRKMRRHPVHDHADTFLMKMIDEETKIIGRTVASRRSVIRADLITPRRSVRMFFQRHKLDVRETVLFRVIGEQRSNLAIGQRSIVFLGHASPRSEMNLINRKWFSPCLTLPSLSQPRAIAKFVS